MRKQDYTQLLSGAITVRDLPKELQEAIMSRSIRGMNETEAEVEEYYRRNEENYSRSDRSEGGDTMGDRAMAQIRTGDGDLFVYTHCRGWELHTIDAIKAIKSAKSRWDDESYAVRIIVDQLTKQGRDEESGFGLMLKPNEEDEYNNNEPSVLIDLVQQTLTITDSWGEGETLKFIEL